MLDLLRGFGSHLAGLLAGNPGDVLASVACRTCYLGGLILGDIGGGLLLLGTLRILRTLCTKVTVEAVGFARRVWRRIGPTAEQGIVRVSHGLPFVFGLRIRGRRPVIVGL
ncbi:hypothetical protein TUM20985_57480 [Mycobacterium antarcticum]|nr:hypothetical protein TUM20985_57480 [Mycolicibacterium sp. TUM20985]GLP81463.1 hypothetical protein TUM20984_28830 [Mycolicibacterium sp. TUM20984]